MWAEPLTVLLLRPAVAPERYSHALLPLTSSCTGAAFGARETGCAGAAGAAGAGAGAGDVRLVWGGYQSHAFGGRAALPARRTFPLSFSARPRLLAAPLDPALAWSPPPPHAAYLCVHRPPPTQSVMRHYLL